MTLVLVENGPSAPGFFRVTRWAVDAIELIPTRVVEAPEVTHVRYTVTGRSKLVLDDCGAGGDLVGPAQPEQ